jgi:aminoglycoside phosphotransferase (APT) family kinase protein
MERPGFPSRAELRARYAARTGARLPDLTYYVVFAMWRMAVLLENHWARHLRGSAAGFDFAYLETAGPAFAARLRRLAETAGLPSPPAPLSAAGEGRQEANASPSPCARERGLGGEGDEAGVVL